MPGIAGPALPGFILWIAGTALAHRMAFLTGDTLSVSAMLFLKETGLPWLEKPFTPEQVLALVARIESA